MKFPIKFIDNNLVFNQENECFAFYELIPFNYSFLSMEEKERVHDNFRQLISQNREGKIHALQIATKASLRATQENSKKGIKGTLKEVALKKVDEQTHFLINEIGDSQVDYRFFIGFKLMLNEQEVTFKNVLNELGNGFLDFIHSVNAYLMNDFLSINNKELTRFLKMEQLLEHKISRRFKVRKVTKDDVGYILEHLYGQTFMTPFEEYVYHLPTIKNDKETLIKKYDLLKASRCEIKEGQRYLAITNEETEKKLYVAYLPLAMVVHDLDMIGSEIFYFQQQQFDFPMDASMNIEILKNKKALTTVRNKKKELKDVDNHAYESDNETNGTIIDSLEKVDELESSLDATKESMYKLNYSVRIACDNLEELKQRCDTVRDYYDDFNIKLARPIGDMLALHQEFIPSSKRVVHDYVQYVKADFLASTGFGATQMVGEKEGIYLGYNIDTGRNVYINPSLPAQGVRGSVTNALAMAFIGSLGGGKSFANNMIVYYSVLAGAKAIVIDPKSERGLWKETLPEIAHEINIVNLTSEPKNKGMLDPYILIQDIKDAENLAIDILTFITGISSRDGEKFPVMVDAIQRVSRSERRGLLQVIEELRKENTETSHKIASHINSFVNFDLASLLFSDGKANHTIQFDKQLNIIQVADLVLPEAEKELEEYTNKELLSVAMLLVISTFSLEFIKSDRSQFKIVNLDEAWSFLQVAQGKALSGKLVRAGRSMNAGVYFVTQNADDLLDEKMKNNIGMKFAFRSTDLVEIKKTLKFFGVDEEDLSNQERLRNLENGQCLFQDLYGRVAVIQVDYVFEDLFKAFDTRPPIQDEDEVV